MENAKGFKSTTSIPHAPEEHAPNTDTSRRAKLLRTAFDGSVQFFLGMHFSTVGPALLDLQEISGTDVEGASTYITSIALGYMTGCLMAGFLYDRVSNKPLLVCVPMTVASVCIALIPYCTSYPAMLTAFFTTSVLTGNPDTAVMADVLWMWQGKSDAATQFMSFAYSLGGVLGPLYTEPFLAPISNTSNEASTQELLPEVTNSTEMLRLKTQSTNLSQYGLLSHLNHSSSSEIAAESVLPYAFLISGIAGLCFSIPFFVLCLKNCVIRKNKRVLKETEEKDAKNHAEKRRFTLRTYVLLAFVFSIFCFLFAMTEDMFNAFLPMFVVSHLSWTKAHGALLSSLYWAVGTVSKLALVFLSRKIDVTKILLLSYIGMVLSLCLFFAAVHSHLQSLVWISTSCFAMSQASVYGGMFTWADSKLLQLDGKVTSVAMVAISLGSMAGSIFLGVMVDAVSFTAFPYMVLSLSVICLLQFSLMAFLLQPFVRRKHGAIRTQGLHTNSDGDIEEKKKFVSTENVIIAESLNGEKTFHL